MSGVRRLLAISATLLAFLVTAAPVAGQTGLVASYGFNEGSGGTTADASGNGHAGTISGASWTTSGRFGSALSFNGSSNTVTVADTALLDLTGAMTIEAWVYPTSATAWRTIVLKEASTGLSYALYGSDDASRPSGWIRRTADVGVTGGSSLPLNTWVHLAVTYNGSSLVLYVNGTAAATKAITGSIVTSSLPLKIGGNSVWGEYFAGRIDEVRVYSRVLTAGEIQTDMNTAIGEAAPLPSPDFSISATPSSRSITQGTSTTYTVTVGSLNGFSGVVNLSASGLPAGATAAFSPSSLAGSGSTTMTVTASGSTPIGNSTLSITGSSGALNRSTTVTLGVTATPIPDFTISATPSSRSLTQGNSTTYTVTVSAVNGFAGTVALAVSGVPANAAGGFSPQTVTAAGTSTLTITTAASTPAGTGTLTITGTSGSLSRTATVSLTINPPSDFTIGVSPASRSVTQGSSTTYTVTIGATNGFAGTVTFSASGLPANTSSTFAPASVAGSGTTTLTVSTTGTTPTGGVTFSVTGTSGALGHGASAGLTVTAPSGGSSGVISVNFVGTGTSMGTSESAGVVPATRWNNASGNSRTTPLALVNQTGAATGATLTWSANSTSRLPITDSAGNRRMMRGFLNTSSSSVTTLTVAGLPAGAYDVYVYADGDNGTSARTGTYAISGPQITNASISLTDAANANFNGTFTRAQNSSGNYVRFTINASGFTVTATPTAGITRRAPVNGLQIVPTGPPPADFALSAAPASQTVTQGGDASYAVNMTALNGFSGTVGLTATGLPAGASASFTPATIAAGGTSTLQVTTAATTPAGTSTVTVTGTSGLLSRSTSVSFTVQAPRYSLSGTISPAELGSSTTVSVGGTATGTGLADSAGAYSVAGLPSGTYLVTPSKNGFTFTPSSRNVSVNGGSVTDIDFTATQSPISVAIASPLNGANVSSTFSISAATSGAVVGVQFRVDGVNVGAEDTSSPYSVSVSAKGGSHTLTAVARDAAGNTVSSTPVSVNVASSSGTSLTVNGAQTFQTMDGLGVNLNSLSWKDGELRPALDWLADELGVTLWRVVFDMEDWEDPNDNADPTVSDWTYYNALYSNAKFQNLWGTLRYLNQRGITSGITLSFMGRVPTWMGGVQIQTALEAEWVEMVVTLLSYARNTEGVQFDTLDPINEPDWDGFEGPQVGASQYTRLLEKLSARLDAVGLSELRFVAPSTASLDEGVNTYIPSLMGNSVVMSKIDHFGLHNYSGSTGGADARIKGSAYSSRNFWMTEFSIPEQMFSLISEGAAGTQIWDAYDSVYNHAILAGRGSDPPNDEGNSPALLSYNSSTGTYARRPQFYQTEAFRFVSPGSIRIAATESNSNLTMLAFKHPATGRVIIVGRNTGSSAITVNGTVSGTDAVAALQMYQCTNADGFTSFVRGADAVVTSGGFVVTIPANAFFTLTSGQ